MRLCAVVLGVLLAMSGAQSASAAMRISQDPGGRVDAYLAKFAMVRDSGEQVIIDGPCASACTLVLGTVPPDRICVTRRATLGFHAAWVYGRTGRPVTSAAGTRFLMSVYPAHIRKWIRRNGGLTPRMIHLRGPELMAMYPVCSTSVSNAH